MCCVGDIGESLEDPVNFSVHTLFEMKLLGMDPKKENWDAWTVNVRKKEFLKKVQDFDPALLNYMTEIWKDAT